MRWKFGPINDLISLKIMSKKYKKKDSAFIPKFFSNERFSQPFARRVTPLTQRMICAFYVPAPIDRSGSMIVANKMVANGYPTIIRHRW